MTTINATALTDILSAEPGPVLTWIGQPEGSPTGQVRPRIELSGPVARRWIAKTDNMLGAEFPFGAQTFAVDMPAHWRTPFWIATPWLRGLQLSETQEEGVCDLVVSDNLESLVELDEAGGSDLLVAQTTESLALSWPGDLPAGVSDGIADVMTYGDFVEDPLTANQDTPLGVEIDGNPLVLSDLLTADLLGLSGVPDNSLAGQRVLVTTVDPVLFTAQMLQLWWRGASVLWVPGGIDADSIAQTERATLVARTLPGDAPLPDAQ